MFDRADGGSGYEMSAVAESEPCLLQLASKLAGEPWSDRPSCVHPTLAAVARGVHDHSSPAGRPALRPFARDLVATAEPGFEACARLVALCASTAVASPDQARVTADERRRLHAARETALCILRRTTDLTGEGPEEEPRLRGSARWWLPVLGWIGLSEPCYRRLISTEQVAEAVVITARASGADRDRRLRQLLKLSIAALPRSNPTNGTPPDETEAEGLGGGQGR